MKLNRQKSGIVVFSARRATKIPMMDMEKPCYKDKNGIRDSKGHHGIVWKPVRKEFKEIPICPKYKYLGTWMDSKLTCGPQIAHIKKKAAHLYVRLDPYLMSATADARKDLWQKMVAPLFNAALALLEAEPSETQRRNLEAVWKLIFKQFMIISKRTNTCLVNDMIGKDIRKIAEATKHTCPPC